MIKELDPVVLTGDLADRGLQAGETLSVETVPADRARPVGRKKIAHARMVA